MNDVFITALNTQKTSRQWIQGLTENMINLYTPGYRESKISFATFLDGVEVDQKIKNTGQGKAVPGTSKENVYLEGEGFFVARNKEGTPVYTRLGEFTFDKEGVYRTKDGMAVQGYILNDKGEVMSGTKPVNADVFNETAIKGGTLDIPTTNIKLWIDPNNGKYLGKYDEFEFTGNGILNGKANGGKVVVPLYKLAIMNFHNAQGLYEIKPGQFIESEASGAPVIGRGEVRDGLYELSNIDLNNNMAYFQQAKIQLTLAEKLISTNKSLLQSAMELMS